MSVQVELKTPNLANMSDGDIFIKKGNQLVPISKNEYLKEMSVELAKNKIENTKFKEEVKEEIKEIKTLLKKIIEVVFEVEHEENN